MLSVRSSMAAFIFAICIVEPSKATPRSVQKLGKDAAACVVGQGKTSSSTCPQTFIATGSDKIGNLVAGSTRIGAAGLTFDGGTKMTPKLYGDTQANLVAVIPSGRALYAIDGAGSPLLALNFTGLSVRSLVSGDVTASGAGVFGRGSFYGGPNYVGKLEDSRVVGLSGSQTAPDSSEGAAGLFEKWSARGTFNTLAAIAHKTVDADNARATAMYGEAVDHAGGRAGGTTSFVEGGRWQGTLVSGSHGSAYGSICVAGTDTSHLDRPSLVTYLVGCEAEVDDQVGPDAPTFGSFSPDRFRVSFLATNGVGPGVRYKADAAFAVNHYSINAYQTGLLLTDKVVDTGVAATAGSSLANGIDFHLARFSNALLWGPINAPIRLGAGGASALSLAAGDVLQIGSSGVSRVAAGAPVQLIATTYRALPTCDGDSAGTMAYITDAGAAITAWHQHVTSGGGQNKAFIACNGTGWFAFDY